MCYARSDKWTATKALDKVTMTGMTGMKRQVNRDKGIGLK